VIKRRIRGLFVAIGNLPGDRGASSFVVQEELEADLGQAAVQRGSESALGALDRSLVGLVGRCLRPDATGKQQEREASNHSLHVSIGHQTRQMSLGIGYDSSLVFRIQ